MRKQSNIRISKGILALMVAGTLLVTGFLISTRQAFAFPDIQATDSSGKPLTGTSSLFYTAHRIPDPRWAPCFSTSCGGPGAGMWFDVYDSNFSLVAAGLTDENGVHITGLTAGATYYIAPQDCNLCHNSTHNVEFYYWYDGDMTKQRSFAAGSNTPVAAAYYRYFDPSQTNPTPGPASGQSSSTPPPPTNNPPPPTNNPPPPTNNPPPPTTVTVTQHRNPIRLDMSDLNSIIDLKQFVIRSINLNQTETASVTNGTTISDDTVPDVSLSGVPVGPTHHMTTYRSLYDIAIDDQQGLMKAENVADHVGLNWNKLSDMQKAYLTLTLEYNHSNSTFSIPDVSLSGVPLGATKTVIHYKSLYDVASGDPTGIEKAEVAANELGIDWSGLSDNQKAYIALVLDFGKPST